MRPSFNEIIQWLWPVLELAGALVFAVKFRRTPLVAVLGALGFGIQVAWGVGWRVLLRFSSDFREASDIAFAAGNMLAMFGLALVLVAVAVIPIRAPSSSPAPAAPPAS